MNMSTNAPENIQLENQIDNISNFLEKLVTSSDEGDELNHPIFNAPQGHAAIADLNKQAHQQAFPKEDFNKESYPPGFGFIPDIPKTPYNYGLMGASGSQNMVTSALANASNTNNSTPRYDSNSYPKMKKRINNKQADEEFPDSSGIDIDATMKELGFTPELFTENKVQTLFYLYSNLEFSIHAEYITTTIYDQKTTPNTMSVSAQTKHAIWSSQKLLGNLREVLKRPMPAEYKSAFTKCEEALADLEQAITDLDRFKYCTLEHHRGDFIRQDADEYLQPLMGALNHLIACVEKSRMYIQIYEQALNTPERYKAALLNSCYEDPRQPLPEQSFPEAASTSSSRPQIARRYIG